MISAEGEWGTLAVVAEALGVPIASINSVITVARRHNVVVERQFKGNMIQLVVSLHEVVVGDLEGTIFWGGSKCGAKAGGGEDRDKLHVDCK